MIYTNEQIKQSILPIAEKYALNAVYMFGSYARNEATENSDIDLLIDRTDSRIKNFLDMGALYNHLSSVLKKEIDIITTQSLEQPLNKRRNGRFNYNLQRERVTIYERQRYSKN